MNNPLVFIDPSGLKSYVYYDPNVFGDGTGLQYAELLARDIMKIM